MKEPMGEFAAVPPRDLWPHEASDFTPWLASDENIGRLGAALGMELEVENAEVAVGPYSADIVARDAVTGAYVVIENQLERTNHDHLGKAITYAAALDAGTVVWIASTFTDEHKRSLDWLNDHVGDDVGFYGVRLEAWRIDDSAPAVRFNVVSRPPDVPNRALLASISGDLSDARQLQLEWWIAFSTALAKSSVIPSVQKPRPQYWFNVALGRSGFHISNVADTWGQRIGVRIYIRNKYGAAEALPQLVVQKNEIESEIGATLEWDPNPDTRDKVIAIYKQADLNNRQTWGPLIDWMVEMTERFRRVFGPRVKRLEI